MSPQYRHVKLKEVERRFIVQLNIISAFKQGLEGLKKNIGFHFFFAYSFAVEIWLCGHTEISVFPSCR